jgi:prephenate dehydrogenase
MIKKIAIIGAGGGMGHWFSDYFHKKDKILSLYDIRPTSLKPSSDMIICKNIRDCIEFADLVLVCVPIKNTPATIEECASKMKSGSILVEISSVKYRSFTALKKVPAYITPLCIHPMFGPGMMDLKQMKILLVPVSNEENEIKILNNLFDQAVITVIPNYNIHDKLIAIVLGLTHYVNLVFANFLSKQDFPYLNEVSGTSFKMQSLLITSMLTEQPALAIDLLIENPSVKKFIQSYLKEAKELAKMIFENNGVDLETTYVNIKTILQRQQNLQLSYERMYDIIEKIK